MSAPLVAPAGAAGEWWRHPFYSYVDHQLDPLVEVIRSQADPGGFLPAGATELRGMIDAVRAAMDALEADLLPAPPTADEAAGHGLSLGRVHQHQDAPDGAWCVYVGARLAKRQTWHLAYVGPDQYGDRSRRVIHRGTWARRAHGNHDALFSLACRILDGEQDVPEFTFPLD